MICFSPDEVSFICDILENIRRNPDLSFMCSQIGSAEYFLRHSSVMEKFLSYSPLTPVTLDDIDVILDAFGPVDAIDSDFLDSDIIRIADSAGEKVLQLQASLLKFPS